VSALPENYVLPVGYEPSSDLGVTFDLIEGSATVMEAHERIQLYILEVQSQRDDLWTAATRFVNAFGAGEFDEPCKVIPYIRRFEEAVKAAAPVDDDEPDGAGYPDMDSAGGDDSMNRAYKEK